MFFLWNAKLYKKGTSASKSAAANLVLGRIKKTFRRVSSWHSVFTGRSHDCYAIYLYTYTDIIEWLYTPPIYYLSTTCVFGGGAVVARPHYRMLSHAHVRRPTGHWGWHRGSRFWWTCRCGNICCIKRGFLMLLCFDKLKFKFKFKLYWAVFQFALLTHKLRIKSIICVEHN